jgi:hypothetical protein
MKQPYTRRKLMIAGTAVAAACAVAGPPASAQTTTTSTATAVKKPPTSATPQMIQEAIQRSHARSEKLRTEGKPEQWGSEEPFTFDPNRR